MRIEAVIFDMDGLLLDTEPLWGVSMHRVAAKHGLSLSPEKFKETTGLRIHEVVAFWKHKYQSDIENIDRVADEIVEDITQLAIEKASVLPGVHQCMKLFNAHNFKIGLASSSPEKMIDDLLTHFKLKDYFQSVCSADHVELGKPHPGVFLKCAEQLNVHPIHCLVLEDSFNGVIAALSARMRVVAVPDEKYKHHPAFQLASANLDSLEQLDDALLEIIQR